ncbi:MAG: tetratricopeptide repeat protein [Methylococcales bacterium]
MFQHKFKLIHLSVLIALLSGCAYKLPFLDPGETDDRADIQDSKNCGPVDKPEEKVKLQLIRQLMDGGKLHAALAHLDASRVKSSEETYLRAEILRRTERSGLAIPLYKQLLHDRCAAGHAYHGLGLVAGRDGKISEALDYFEQARARLPTDVRVRNDLGYAWLLDGQYQSARYEFQTALELDENNEFSISNLVLLYLMTDQVQKAQSFAVRLKLSGESFQQLVARARELKRAPDSPEQAGHSAPIGVSTLTDEMAGPVGSGRKEDRIKTTATSEELSASRQSLSLPEEISQ